MASWRWKRVMALGTCSRRQTSVSRRVIFSWWTSSASPRATAARYSRVALLSGCPGEHREAGAGGAVDLGELAADVQAAGTDGEGVRAGGSVGGGIPGH